MILLSIGKEYESSIVKRSLLLTLFIYFMIVKSHVKLFVWSGQTRTTNTSQVMFCSFDHVELDDTFGTKRTCVVCTPNRAFIFFLCCILSLLLHYLGVVVESGIPLRSHLFVVVVVGHECSYSPWPFLTYIMIQTCIAVSFIKYIYTLNIYTHFSCALYDDVWMNLFYFRFVV